MTSPQLLTRQKPTILVIDDDPLICDLLCDLLEMDGLFAIPLGKADQAIVLLASQSSEVDLILTDINMPGVMDGADLANHVRMAWPWIPVVVMSGLESLQTAGLNKDLTLIRKPFRMEDVLNVIRRELLAGSGQVQTGQIPGSITR